MLAANAHAADAEPERRLLTERIEAVTVLGDPRTQGNLPAAARVLGPDELERFAFTDVYELLREVPGVYLQTEGGAVNLISTPIPGEREVRGQLEAGEFDTDIADPAFFGAASAGEPLPYLPDHQLSASIGLTDDRVSIWLRGNYQDSSCVQPACGPFLETDDSLTFDLCGEHRWRPGRPQAVKAGVRWSL